MRLVVPISVKNFERCQYSTEKIVNIQRRRINLLSCIKYFVVEYAHFKSLIMPNGLQSSREVKFKTFLTASNNITNAVKKITDVGSLFTEISTAERSGFLSINEKFTERQAWVTLTRLLRFPCSLPHAVKSRVF